MENYELKSLKPLDYKSGQAITLENKIYQDSVRNVLIGYSQLSNEIHKNNLKRKQIEQEQEDMKLAKKICWLCFFVIVVSSLMGIWEY